MVTFCPPGPKNAFLGNPTYVAPRNLTFGGWGTQRLAPEVTVKPSAASKAVWPACRHALNLFHVQKRPNTAFRLNYPMCNFMYLDVKFWKN